MPNKIDKWNQRYLSDLDTIPQPAFVLKENNHLLPSRGDALDLACGRGGNALYMAKLGLAVSAWDFSSVAIDKLNTVYEAENLIINTSVRDIERNPPKPESFDVIVVSYFLDRNINKAIINALKPGGVLFYQTYTRNKVTEIGPDNPDYLLKENELLNIFRPLKVRVYREESFCGDIKKGLRNQALFIGEKVSLND